MIHVVWETLRRGTEKESILASFFSQYQTLGRPLNFSLDAHGSRWNVCLLLIHTHLHLTTAFSTLENTKFQFWNFHFHSYFTKNTHTKKRVFLFFLYFLSFFEQLDKGISLFNIFQKVDLHLSEASQTVKFLQLLYSLSVC